MIYLSVVRIHNQVNVVDKTSKLHKMYLSLSTISQVTIIESISEDTLGITYNVK